MNKNIYQKLQRLTRLGGKMAHIILISFLYFFIGYYISGLIVSVLYHRALCHKAMTLSPGFLKFVSHWGFILSGVDPIIWIITHRLHHLHSDTINDPHSPQFIKSLSGINDAHLKYYAEINNDLKAPNSKYKVFVNDIPFGLHPFMRLPNIPFMKISLGNALVFVIHFAAYYGLYLLCGNIYYPMALGIGLLSHPIQGVFVNYFGHKYGYTTYKTNDSSKNNQIVAFLIFGEGYQNNHHHSPNNPKLSVLSKEFDSGFIMCRFLRKLSLVNF